MDKNLKIPWYVVVESVRLFLQLLQNYSVSNQEAEDSLEQSNWFYERFQNYGPIVQFYGINALPPIFANCQSVDEIKAMNVMLQQSLIAGVAELNSYL